VFDYQKDYRFAWPVKVLVPTLDGQVEKEFTGLFRLIGKEEASAILQEVGPELASGETVRRAWTGWKDDLTEDGKTLPYSEAKRDELFGVPFVAQGVAVAYWRAATGAVLQKN